MYDQLTLDKIRAATDIAAVVGEYVALKKAGTNSLKGLCPFHQEKTPSFHVNTGQQFFKCFGCGVAGNVFGFVSRMENVPFPEAVKRLAEKAHITLADSDTPEAQDRRRLLTVLETAAALYHRTLMESPDGAGPREYLAKRGLEKRTIEQFKLGYSTGREIFSARLHPEILSRAGLSAPSRDGGRHDRMHHRLVIPITDEAGRITGFGGRAMEEDQQPKYLNTPETPLFKKSHTLFALPLAREAIRKTGKAVLVEGYFDAIAAHAHGIANTIAVLGTSLTEPQLRMLKRFAPTLLIVYDEDAGGNEAAVRGLDLASEAGFEVKVVRLPGGADPDEFLMKRGDLAFLKAMEDAAGGEEPSDSLQERGVAVSLFDFRYEVASRGLDLATIEGKKRIVAGLLPYLSRVPNAIERNEYVRRLAERLNLRERDVSEELEKVGPGATRSPVRPAAGAGAVRKPDSGTPSAHTWRAERCIIAGVLKHRTAALNVFLGMSPEVFGRETGPLAERLRGLISEGRSFSVASLMDDFQDVPDALDLLSSAEEGGATGAAALPDGVFQEAATLLKRLHGRTRLKAVQQELERAHDPAAIARLLEEKQRLVMAAS
jgi:DNA primase